MPPRDDIDDEEDDILLDEQQLVSFKLGRETFAVDVNQVREIGRVEEITKVPKMPSFIEGVMNLRGQITTVIDLRKRFGIVDGDGKLTNKSRIIVVEIKDNQLGIIVDEVRDVIRIQKSNIDPPPKNIAGRMDTKFLTGICKQSGDLYMLLDLSRVLSDEEIATAMDMESSAYYDYDDASDDDEDDSDENDDDDSDEKPDKKTTKKRSKKKKT